MLIRAEQVAKTLELHAGGATVPFIARYRKEATGNLDEVQIQAIIDRDAELRELDERRAAILKSIEEQGKLTPELAAAIAAVRTRAELEDLYLPYRPKRRTRATIAKERGYEPLADVMWGVPGAKWEQPLDDDALAGARDICAERVSESAELRRFARMHATRRGAIGSAVRPEKKDEKTKFEMYYDWREPIAAVPSHRALAVFRGETEEVLNVKLQLPDEEIVTGIKQRLLRRTPMPDQLALAIEDGWKRLLSVSIEGELRADLKQRADAQAIDVFGQNLRNLLLAPPAGSRRVLALDPGLRTGIKTAMLDATGKLLETATLYTERSASERSSAQKLLQRLVAQHKPDLIAVGNGTGSREAETFVRAAVSDVPLVSVPEQGASVYSASEVARDEFPDLDVSLRGAVSIGRRLQDPLGELVKIEPKSIGVGQYQHDVHQPLLKKKLGETVDWCVNLVGVDANTASPQLLEHVSGIGPVLAKRIVEHRNTTGPFPARRSLLEVRGLGARAFEQCAGFLRIRDAHPLDDSAVHPERYPLVEKMAKDLGVQLRELVANGPMIEKVDWKRYVGGDVGEPTLRDILTELRKPGRDPRGSFEPPKFRDDVQTLTDLREGMTLEGVVTNVTAFGAFVDVGVHRDGLVHVSQIAGKPKVGDRVTARVVSVDLDRKRFALTMR
ncbi:MAG: RNA-binding transcriptional accessory protein [Acidobacteria bacterium]|nr:RNA-binding transcriptional accessory protein [Acidobacteriota bacterium]